jgi:hypothetical protein
MGFIVDVLPSTAHDDVLRLHCDKAILLYRPHEQSRSTMQKPVRNLQTPQIDPA